MRTPQDHQAKQSLIKKLKDHRDKQVRVVVNFQEQSYYGNLDDGEDSRYKDTPASFDHVVKNVYLTAGADDSESEFSFLRSSNEGKDFLVPFNYHVTQNFNFRTRATYNRNTIEALAFGDEEHLLASYALRAWLDDGVKQYFQPGLTQEEKRARENWPLLEKKGCRYDPKTHSISGDIDTLVQELTPLWKE